MQQTEIAGVSANGGKSPRGRKTEDGQEQAINLTALKKGIGELVDLHIRKKSAADDLSSAIKAIAEKSGLLSAAIRKLVKARAGEKFEDKKREVEQLSLVFEEIGEG